MLIQEEFVKVFLFMGAAISTGVASLSGGFAEGHIAAEATKSMMIQPKASDSILRSMLISQAVTETGAIFGLVISLLLIFGGFTHFGADWARAFSFLGAGLAMGLGCTGPNFGSGYSGAQAMKSIGRVPSQNGRITTNMLIGQALSQTSAIFALVVAFMLLYTVPSQTSVSSLNALILKSCAYLGAGLTIGLGTIGPGAGIGFVAGKANLMLSKYSKSQSLITRTMFLGAAVTESTSIYALVTAFLLIFIS